MQVIASFFTNQIIIAAGSSWFIAQVVKTIIYLIVNKTLRLERMIGDGGMPSCHSATVCSMAVAVALTQGVDSPLFAVTLFVAIIVMHDAMGVRLETGRQARIINEIVREFRERGMEFFTMPAEQRLKEFVGHTGNQVLVGACIGIIVAIGEHYLFFN